MHVHVHKLFDGNSGPKPPPPYKCRLLLPYNDIKNRPIPMATHSTFVRRCSGSSSSEHINNDNNNNNI